MPLGPHIPEWVELQQRLGDLAFSAAATTVCVFDTWGLPWCCAPQHNVGVARDSVRFLRRGLASLQTSLQQGGSLDRAFAVDEAVAYLRSFASVYVLVLRYEGLFDLKRTKELVTAALPRITALTIALPPPHGPGAGSAAAKGRA